MLQRFRVALGIERLYAYGVPQQLEALASAIEDVCTMDPVALGDGEAVVELHRALARLEAAATRATAAFEASRVWADDGARSAAAWLAVRCGLPNATARRRSHLGRTLRHLPVAERSWVAGDIGEAQVAALARALTTRTSEALARDEAMLVGHATTARFGRFVRVLGYWSQCADPDGAEDDAAQQVDARRFHLSQSLGGTWLGDVVLDPVRGAIVANQLGRINDELFEGDWAEARARRGEATTVDDLARTPAQRRADALVEMAQRAATADPDGRRPAPLFTVLVSYESFAGRICELADGTVVTPGALVDWLDRAWIERVVFDGPSRVIDVGVARRLFSGATRRAVEVRDRQCFHEYCDVPAGRCQVDHVQPHSVGGATEQRNGRMACGFHNRDRHRRRGPPDEDGGDV